MDSSLGAGPSHIHTYTFVQAQAPQPVSSHPGHGRSQPADVVSLLSSDDEEDEDEDAGPPLKKRRTALANSSPVPYPLTPSASPSLSLDHGHPIPPPLHSSPSAGTDSTNPPEDCRDSIVPITEPELCPEQAKLVDTIMSGANVFYTGSAGCGKSTVLKAFVRRLRAQGKTVDIIAPTGRAALDINGSTTWTYAGWTPDSHRKPLDKLKTAARGKIAWERLCSTHVLVIDEISMVENLHFERLNHIMKAARNNTQPFGGVQLVVTGDFCQLPPVKPFQHCMICGREMLHNPATDQYKCPQNGHPEYLDADKWAFRSDAWEECQFVHVQLSQIHRQSDEKFIRLLQKCRMGQPFSAVDIGLLLQNKTAPGGAVKLFSTTREVERHNRQNMEKLCTKPYHFSCHDYFRWNKDDHPLLANKRRRNQDGNLVALQDHRYEQKIELKQGTLVVLLFNLDLENGLVNGSQGIIAGWEEYKAGKLPRARRYKELDPGEPPSLGGEYAKFKQYQIQAFIEQQQDKSWPIVLFKNGVRRTIYADCTVNELGYKEPFSLLSRTQIPLAPAWAMSIHKSQGMTLSRVVVNLSRAFEEGQVYVALSRARGLDGLKIEGDARRLMALKGGNEQVREFLRQKLGIEH